MTIETEQEEPVEARTSMVSDDEDVAGALFDIVAARIGVGEPDPDRIAILPRAHPDEDDLSLWFG